MNEHETVELESLQRLQELMDVGNIDLRTREGQEMHDQIVRSRQVFCRLMGVSDETLEHLSLRQALPNPARVAGAIAVLGANGLNPDDIYRRYDRVLTFSEEKLEHTISYLRDNIPEYEKAIMKHPRLLGYNIASVERNIGSLEERGLSRAFIFEHHFILGKVKIIQELMSVIDQAGLPAAHLLQHEPLIMNRTPAGVKDSIATVKNHTMEPGRILAQRPLVMTVAAKDIKERLTLLISIKPKDAERDLVSEIPDILLHSQDTLRDALPILRRYGMAEDTKKIRMALKIGLRNIITAYHELSEADPNPSWEDLMRSIKG